MLTTTVIALSVGVAIIALLDIFLSDSQKAAFGSSIDNLWLWLSDRQKVPILQRLKQGRVLVGLWLSGILLPIIGILGSNSPKTVEMRSLLVVSHLALFVVVTGPALVYIIRSALSLMGVLTRLLIFAGCSFFLLSFLSFVMVLAPWYLGWNATSDFYSLGETAGDIVFIQVSTTIIVPALVSHIILPALRAILYVSEFVVRRIAEHQKGPILAASAAIGGVAAIIKAFL